MTFFLLFYQQKSTTFPSQNKYFFKIDSVTELALQYSFKSMETGQYLHADCSGRVYVAAVPSWSLVHGTSKLKETHFWLLYNFL